ncbi:hypothetical protein [Tychonema sp. BBK16]|uniref:hypothetical protein n=1 Tax=Tychonema sp. BBK16 TaxID=2699888 RepID=UPI001F1F84F5|nr:hypothetical protein [Tychonema sp. BBK16]MCF6374425.1 hypothetical protein [Tychonema sp. BBK16]
MTDERIGRNRVFYENTSLQPTDSVKIRFLWSECVNPVNIKLEQCAIARNAFQGHSVPILDLSVTFTDKQESLNDPN